MIQGASRMMRGIGGALFAMQLGQVVGQLATEVVSGGDIGIPLHDRRPGGARPPERRRVRRRASTSPPTRSSSTSRCASSRTRGCSGTRGGCGCTSSRRSPPSPRGIDIDTDRLEQLAEGFDPSNTEELRDAVVNGALIRPKSEAQEAALGRLETMLALVEGWVDAVTADATSRLPKSDAIAESIRRRRASGGPAESAFATLVGLELRPRRMREAAAMWRAVTEAVGVEARDALWAHPDLLPTAEDLDDPERA